MSLIRRRGMLRSKQDTGNWVNVIAPISTSYYLRNAGGIVTVGNGELSLVSTSSKNWTTYAYSAPKYYKYGEIKNKKIRGSLKISNCNMVGDGYLLCGVATTTRQDASGDRQSYGFPFETVYRDGTYSFEGVVNRSLMPSGNNVNDAHWFMFITYLYAPSGSRATISDLKIEVDMDS